MARAIDILFDKETQKNLDKDLVTLVDKQDKYLKILKSPYPRFHRDRDIIQLPGRYENETAAHELGHYIDDILCDSPYSYSSKIYMEDPFIYLYEDIVKDFKKNYGWFARRSPRTMLLQDLIHIVSNGSYKSKYYRTEDELENVMVCKAEVFADIFGIVLLGDQKQIDFVKRNLPNQYREFRWIITGGEES